MTRTKRILLIILPLLIVLAVGIRLLTAKPNASTNLSTSPSPADTTAAPDDASPAPTDDTPTAPANPAADAPTATATAKPTATATSKPTATATSKPTATATTSPTATATTSPTATSKPAATATSKPTATATAKPTATATASPTATATTRPTATSTAEATASAAPAAEAATVPGNPMAAGNTPSIDITEESKGLLDGVKIGIDPGHQAHSNSAQEPVSPGSKETKAKVSSGTQGVKTRVPEYEVNLQVALLLKDALEAQGATVCMTRDTNDVDISNVERAEMMNELGVDVVLRLHCNGSTNQSTSGIGLYVKSSGEGAEESYAISEVLIVAMGEATGANTESVHVRDTYSGLNWSTVPSILVEMGYMSNPDEDEKLCSPEYQSELVHGMVDGLITYFSEHPVSAPSASPSVSPEASVSPAPEKK